MKIHSEPEYFDFGLGAMTEQEIKQALVWGIVGAAALFIVPRILCSLVYLRTGGSFHGLLAAWGIGS
jgi:hypothetical protein